MADRYARTDYTELSEADQHIQSVIEEGRLEEAKQLILAKGDPNEREKKMRRLQAVAEKQKQDLARDFYGLYTIHLNRMDHDSALYYLVRRAELDTTNAQWQLDAGLAYERPNLHYTEALALYRRAARHAHLTPVLMAKALNNIAGALSCLGKTDEALTYYQQALDLYQQIYGADHPLTAARRMNIGVVYYNLNRLDSAQSYFLQAEKAYMGAGEEYNHLRAKLKNSMANICAARGQWPQAEQYEREALLLINSVTTEQSPLTTTLNRIDFLTALGIICYQQNRKQEALTHWREAYNLAIPALGDTHSTSAELKQYISRVESELGR